MVDVGWEIVGSTALERPAPEPQAQRRALQARPDLIQQCLCGARLVVAGAWTCWKCGTCHRLFEREDTCLTTS